MPSKLHCLFLPLGLTVEPCVSLKAEAKICGVYTKKVHSCKDRAIESKRRENEKRRKKVIKISGWHRRGQTSKQQQRPHQYENEPAVTVAAIRLPWHFGCLEDVQLQGSVFEAQREAWEAIFKCGNQPLIKSADSHNLTHSSGEGVYLNHVPKLSQTVNVTFWTITASSHDIRN